MSAPRWFLVLLVGLTAVVAVVLVRQRQRGLQLRKEIVQQQRSPRATVPPPPKASPPTGPSEEWLRLEQEQAAIARLRAELAMLKQRTESVPPPRPKPARAAASPLVGADIAAKDWRNAGTATPDAMFETALWAAATGDLDSLAAVFNVDPGMGEELAAYVQQLPAPLRDEFRTPEHLLALLTAGDVPLGSAKITSQLPLTETKTRIFVELTDTDGRKKTSVFHAEQANGNWRLTVPRAVLRRYREKLHPSDTGETPP